MRQGAEEDESDAGQGFEEFGQGGSPGKSNRACVRTLTDPVRGIPVNYGTGARFSTEHTVKSGLV
jgi:hypothetical protein